MIWHKGAKKWGPRELVRVDLMRDRIGCIACWLMEGVRRNLEEVHHIISGNKRMGHWYTLPLCKACHGKMHDSTYSHAQQIDMWLKVQHALSLSDELPPTKTVPRRVA